MNKNRSLLLFSVLLLICGKSYAQVDTLLFDGLKRTYHVHLPSSYDGSSQLPIVVAIHPFYGSAGNYEAMTGFSNKADMENFIVVYPNGTGSPASWNAGGCCHPATTDHIDDVGFISVLLDTLTKRYNIDPTRIYAAGFSNGSMLAYRLASELSGKIAAIAAGSGQMTFTNINPSQGVAIIHFHALDDYVVPYNGNSMFPPVDTVLAVWGQINNCSLTPDTIYDTNGVLAKKWAAAGTGADIILYRSNTGGHLWPIGNVSQTEVAWDFLKSHSKQFTSDISINNTANKIHNFSLKQNYPNPFNPSTDISFDLPVSSFVTLKVFDITGREVAILISEYLSSGHYIRRWSANKLPSGAYFCRLQAGSYIETKKLLLLK
jgi:polyhydroxybutyrate depolymerase